MVLHFAVDLCQNGRQTGCTEFHTLYRFQSIRSSIKAAPQNTGIRTHIEAGDNFCAIKVHFDFNAFVLSIIPKRKMKAVD
jgi:hypothetical protein